MGGAFIMSLRVCPERPGRLEQRPRTTEKNVRNKIMSGTSGTSGTCPERPEQCPGTTLVTVLDAF